MFYGVIAVFISTVLFPPEGTVLGQQDEKIAPPQIETEATFCSQFSKAEQNFAAQMNDIKNKKMFCSQFTPEQRQQAMRIAAELDTRGNRMSADQAVQSVNARASQKPRSNGGCPVK